MQKVKGSWNKHSGTNQKMWQERASLASETAWQAQIIFFYVSVSGWKHFPRVEPKPARTYKMVSVTDGHCNTSAYFLRWVRKIDLFWFNLPIKHFKLTKEHGFLQLAQFVDNGKVFFSATMYTIPLKLEQLKHIKLLQHIFFQFQENCVSLQEMSGCFFSASARSL